MQSASEAHALHVEGKSSGPSRPTTNELDAAALLGCAEAADVVGGGAVVGGSLAALEHDATRNDIERNAARVGEGTCGA